MQGMIDLFHENDERPDIVIAQTGPRASARRGTTAKSVRRLPSASTLTEETSAAAAQT